MPAPITPEILNYILAQTRHDDPLLAEMEVRAASEGFPIIGPHVGPWLYTLTRMIGGQRVYELGSGYGYSTWYFCKAVQGTANPTVVHTVWDAQLSADARVNLTAAGFADFTQFVEGEAVEALSAAEGGWDVIFMDIDKEGYPGALPVIEQKLRPGGLLIVDNMIWSGKVADPADTRESTQAIRELTRMLRESPRWEMLILPLRDGVAVARFAG
ncbi:MAG: O-methyltransferase [bacterium]|nr:O-methyltransferase [bacterium]